MPASPGPKPIRSMIKGLQCLNEINTHNGLTVADCASLVGLPRTTAFRVLETLVLAGYVFRDMDGAYRATARVRTLSNGYDEEEWVRDIAFPELQALSKRLIWSVGLATPVGLSMRIRSSTDNQNPLSIDRYPAGQLLPMESSSPGHVYLAFLPEEVRGKLLDACERSSQSPTGPLRRRDAFEAYLATVREKGYAQVRITPKETTLSVPILLGERVLGACGMKFITSALPQAELDTKVLPAVQESAARIAAKLAEASPGLGQHP